MDFFYLADGSNETPEPIGIQISHVMTINSDDTWRKRFSAVNNRLTESCCTKQRFMFLNERALTSVGVVQSEQQRDQS